MWSSQTRQTHKVKHISWRLFEWPTDSSYPQNYPVNHMYECLCISPLSGSNPPPQTQTNTHTVEPCLNTPHGSGIMVDPCWWARLPWQVCLCAWVTQNTFTVYSWTRSVLKLLYISKNILKCGLIWPWGHYTNYCFVFFKMLSEWQQSQQVFVYLKATGIHSFQVAFHVQRCLQTLLILWYY